MPIQDGQTGRFLSGNNGGPGRPKGSRNKLGEKFLTDLQADWEANGVQAIADVREARPHEYLKVVASILPKELNVRVSDLDELTDDQIARQLASLSAQLAAAGLVLGEGVEASAGAEQASCVSPLH